MLEGPLFDNKDKGPPYHDNVLNMGEFLLRRQHRFGAEYERLNSQAEALSKQDKDKFAAPVRSKADSIKAKMENVSNQLKFIIRGGLPQPAPPPGNFGYTLSGQVLRQPWIPSIVPPPGYTTLPTVTPVPPSPN